MWKHDTIPRNVERMNENKQKIIIIVGPTASGKTALSLCLAKELGGEIISADSRQIYRGLDIGTGKVTKAEMGDIPHHLIDILDPDDAYSAADFTKDAGAAIEDIVSRGKVPIIAGGTFFYIEALLGRKSLPAVPPNRELRERLESMETDTVFAILEKRDPARAKTIDRHNKRRVIRAIEITEALGAVPAPVDSTSPYDTFIIGIDMDKETLRSRIVTRLNERLDNGMIEEARTLHANGLSYERMDELGLEYRYLAIFLKGESSLFEMCEKLAIEIWHFAKRQRMWLRKMEGVRWYVPTEFDRAIEDVKGFLKD